MVLENENEEKMIFSHSNTYSQNAVVNCFCLVFGSCNFKPSQKNEKSSKLKQNMSNNPYSLIWEKNELIYKINIE